jgi:hypothetical protein
MWEGEKSQRKLNQDGDSHFLREVEGSDTLSSTHPGRGSFLSALTHPARDSTPYFIYLFFVALAFELRALHLLGRHFTT